jgi:hypothetical protein
VIWTKADAPAIPSADRCQDERVDTGARLDSSRHGMAVRDRLGSPAAHRGNR